MCAFIRWHNNIKVLRSLLTKMGINFNIFKRKYTRHNDIRYLKHLYNANALFGFFPFYDFEEHDLKGGIYKYHPIYMMILRSIAYVYVLDQFRRFYFTTHLIPVVLSFIENILVFFLSTVPTIELTFRKRNVVRNFFLYYHKTDEMMANFRGSNEKFYDTFVVEIISFQVIFCVVLSSDLWLNNGLVSKYAFSIVGAILFIMNQVFLYVICNFALALRSRFKYLNVMIVNLIKYDPATMTLKSLQIHTFFTLLLDLTYMFNELFGWTILLYVAAMFIGFLQCFSNLISINEVNDFAVENISVVIMLLVSIAICLN